MSMPQLAPPKIGYVLKRYPRYSETFIVNEILAHEAAGQEIEIFALRPVQETHFQDIIAQVKAPVTRIPEKPRNSEVLWDALRAAQAELPDAWSAIADMGEATGRDVYQAILIARECRRRGVQHLHAHFGTISTTIARLAAHLAGIRYTFTAHAKDIFYNYEENLHLDLKIRDAARVVTVSDFNVDFLRDKFGPIARNVTRIYNGLDLDRFSFAEPDTGSQEILTVGRLIEKKGFHILVEAVRILRAEGRDVTCRIIGDGEEGPHLAAQIEATGLAGIVTLEGPKPQAGVMRALRRAAVFACPCIVGRDGNRDGLPTVLLEAMALGTPAVGTEVTGIPELVRDGETGFCAPECDADALAERLGKLLDSPELRVKFARAGRALIEAEFDGAKNAARLREVFAEAMADEPLLRRGVA